MSNFLQPNPNNIDYYIQTAQVRQYNKLCNVWTVNDSSYNCFGRAYRNPAAKTGDGYYPEFFYNNQYVAPSGNSYNGGMFFEDSLACFSFFDLIEIVRLNNADHKARLQLIFSVDLSKITPGGITDAGGQRLDEIA